MHLLLLEGFDIGVALESKEVISTSLYDRKITEGTPVEGTASFLSKAFQFGEDALISIFHNLYQLRPDFI